MSLLNKTSFISSILNQKRLRLIKVSIIPIIFVLFSGLTSSFAVTAHNDFTNMSATGSNCLKGFNGTETLGCHDIHQAPTVGLQRIKTDSVDLLATSDEKEICFTCHDGTVSSYNTKNDFGENYADKTSAHNIFTRSNPGFLLCSDCHTPHMVPDEGEPASGWKGNEVIGLLRVLVSNIWYYLINSDNTAWTDATDQKKLSNPSDFCGGCHTVNNQYFVGSAHDTNLTTPPSNRPTTSTSTMIKCNVCHQWHGADNEMLLSTRVNNMTVSANNNNQCYACHTNPISQTAYQGKDIFEATKHFAVTTSTTAAVNTSSRYEAGYCMNCHDPHGTQYNDFRRGQNQLCFSCHDALTITIPDNYSYRGQSTYAISAHANISDSNTIWPSTAYTGGSIGATTGASAGECINCHAPMGRDDESGNETPFAKLLMKWESSTDSNEQALCFGGDPNFGACHAKAYDYNQPSDNFYSNNSVNIFDNFSYSRSGTGPGSGATINARHDIFKSDQNDSGARVECFNCHNTHLNNRKYDFNENQSRVSDPDDTTRNYATEYSPAASFSNSQPFRSTASDNDSSFTVQMLNYVNYCLKCHDNVPPTGVDMGAAPPTDILSSFANPTTSDADSHGRGDGAGANLKFPYFGSNPGDFGNTTEAFSAMNCTDCHDSHGSSNLYHLKTTISINGTILTSSGVTSVTDNKYGGPNGWCSTCHSALPSNADHDGPEDVCGDCHYHGASSTPGRKF